MHISNPQQPELLKKHKRSIMLSNKFENKHKIIDELIENEQNTTRTSLQITLLLEERQCDINSYLIVLI